MKKLLLFTISFLLLLSGCSQNKSSAIKPYEIKIGSETLSLYGDKEKFGENGFEVFESSNSIAGLLAGCKDNHIVVYDDKISSMFIYSEDVITYKSISVGDDVSKIEDTFEYEWKMGDDDYAYNVFFNEYGDEIESTDITTRAYSIGYWSKDNKITEIWIGFESD